MFDYSFGEDVLLEAEGHQSKVISDFKVLFVSGMQFVFTLVWWRIWLKEETV
jgi:hypothetical protein